MAGIPKVNITFDADLAGLKKGVSEATGDVSSFGDKVGDFGKKAGLAFAAATVAAAAYASKLAVEGVKAALEDEASQVKLRVALENATGATDKQIASVENHILKMSLATGVSDDKLRPALSRLALSTNDVSKAQDLLSLAMDISTQTSKPLDAVANALGKAYDGNTAALGKLGIGMSSAELKTMSFTDVQGKLTDLFGGAAAKNADTYQGRIDRLKVAFDEAKETIGFALLPMLGKLMDFVNDNIVPAFTAFSESLGDKSGVGSFINNLVTTIQKVASPVFDGMKKAFGYISDAIADNKDTLMAFVGYIKDYVAPVIGVVLGKAFEVVGGIISVTIDAIGAAMRIVMGIIDGVIASINFVIRGLNLIKPGSDIKQIGTTSGSGGGATGGSHPAAGTTTSTSGSSTITVPTYNVPTMSSAGTSSAAAGAALVAATVGGVDVSQNYSENSGQGISTGQNVVIVPRTRSTGDTNVPVPATVIAPTINIGVAGDPEGVARTIVDILNSSYFRGTGGALALQGFQ